MSVKDGYLVERMNNCMKWFAKSCVLFSLVSIGLYLRDVLNNRRIQKNVFLHTISLFLFKNLLAAFVAFCAFFEKKITCTFEQVWMFHCILVKSRAHVVLQFFLWTSSIDLKVLSLKRRKENGVNMGNRFFVCQASFVRRTIYWWKQDLALLN